MWGNTNVRYRDFKWDMFGVEFGSPVMLMLALVILGLLIRRLL